MSVAAQPQTSPYGMTAPTLDDVRAAVLRASDEPTWARLWHAAGVAGDGDPGDGDPGDPVRRLIAAMCTDDDRLLALHGRSLSVRLRAYAHLVAGNDRLAA